MVRSLLALPLLFAAPFAFAQALPPEQAQFRAHVAYLASDEMRGREPGTPEFDKAADYVVAQMKVLGIKPAGVDGGWFQPVTLVTVKPAGPATLGVTRGGKRAALDVATDFAGIIDPANKVRALTGEAVFAGYGRTLEAGGADDFAGLDVRGKIVLLLLGNPRDAAPGGFNPVAKIKAAMALGAAGTILVEPTGAKGIPPFAMIAGFLAGGETMLANPDGSLMQEDEGPAPMAFLSVAGAEKLFAGSPIAWANVVAAQQAGTAVPRGALGASADFSIEAARTPISTRNVVGLIPGSDPVLKGQYLVLSAHLDHVGVGKPDATGDTIYNGAMDNAVGVASILEVSRAIKKSGKRPRRSILVMALTGEEKGLFGSAYFAAYPTVPKAALVGNINLDMPIFTYPLVDVVGTGAEHSSLGPSLAKAAKAVGLNVVPDPLPEENFFVRSDHYSFVKAGVPAISVDTGPGGEGAAAIKEFLAKHYHKPSDQITLPFNWQSAATYVRMNYLLMRDLADADARPRWNKGDEYGVKYKGYGAE